jgi:hypothetical protein
MGKCCWGCCSSTSSIVSILRVAVFVNGIIAP